MANLFIRTSLAPYRVDIYNILHDKLNCKMCFYWSSDSSQKFDEKGMKDQCHFVPYVLKGIKIGRSSRKICTEIWKLLKENNPNIVIVPEFQISTIQVLLYRFLFRKKFKVISMCDDSFDMVTNDNDFTWIHKLARKLIVPFLDDLLLVDSRVVEWYRKKYKKGIWLPIIRNEKNEIPLYEKSLPLSTKYIQTFGLKEKKILLYVGRFDPVKNLEVLLSAINIAKEEFTTVFVGGGELELKLKTLAQHCNKEIIFAGHYTGDGVRAWYNVSDVFILSSKREAFGAVTNEALIAGNYSIISEHAGSACLITPSNGVVINPYDEYEIAQSIDEAMSRIDISSNKPLLKANKMPFAFDTILDDVILTLKKL